MAMTDDGEHVVADIYRRIGDEHTREVGEWLHEIVEVHSLEIEDGLVIPPSVSWLATAVSHYIHSMALENEIMGDEENNNGASTTTT